MKTETQTVRQFHMTIMETRGGAKVSPMEHEIGEWVKHCEHAAKITALEAEVQKLREGCKWAHILLGSCPQSNMDYDICMEKLRAALNSNAGEKGAR